MLWLADKHKILPKSSVWCFAFDVSYRMVPAPSLHRAVAPESLTHVKARNSKQNTVFVYLSMSKHKYIYIHIQSPQQLTMSD